MVGPIPEVRGGCSTVASSRAPAAVDLLRRRPAARDQLVLDVDQAGSREGNMFPRYSQIGVDIDEWPAGF